LILDIVAAHYDINGKPDSFGKKTGVFAIIILLGTLIPLLVFGISLLMRIVSVESGLSEILYLIILILSKYSK
jgi:hypothetical protein